MFKMQNARQMKRANMIWLTLQDFIIEATRLIGVSRPMEMQGALESALNALDALLTFSRLAKSVLSAHRPLLRQCRLSVSKAYRINSAFVADSICSSITMGLQRRETKTTKRVWKPLATQSLQTEGQVDVCQNIYPWRSRCMREFRYMGTSEHECAGGLKIHLRRISWVFNWLRE